MQTHTTLASSFSASNLTSNSWVNRSNNAEHLPTPKYPARTFFHVHAHFGVALPVQSRLHLYSWFLLFCLLWDLVPSIYSVFDSMGSFPLPISHIQFSSLLKDPLPPWLLKLRDFVVVPLFHPRFSEEYSVFLAVFYCLFIPPSSIKLLPSPLHWNCSCQSSQWLTHCQSSHFICPGSRLRCLLCDDLSVLPEIL